MALSNSDQHLMARDTTAHLPSRFLHRNAQLPPRGSSFCLSAIRGVRAKDKAGVFFYAVFSYNQWAASAGPLSINLDQAAIRAQAGRRAVREILP